MFVITTESTDCQSDRNQIQLDQLPTQSDEYVTDTASQSSYQKSKEIYHQLSSKSMISEKCEKSLKCEKSFKSIIHHQSKSERLLKTKEKQSDEEKNRQNQRCHQKTLNDQSHFLKYLATTIGFEIDIKKTKRKATCNGNKLIINAVKYIDEKGIENSILLDDLMNAHVKPKKPEKGFDLEEQRYYSFNFLKELLLIRGFEIMEKKLYRNNIRGFVMSPTIIETITIPEKYLELFPSHLHFSGIITREKMENAVIDSSPIIDQKI